MVQSVSYLLVTFRDYVDDIDQYLEEEKKLVEEDSFEDDDSPISILSPERIKEDEEGFT